MQRLAVGKILQSLRKAKGITQEQLSEILGVSSAAISKWENEQMYPDINFFPILARYFNVSIDCLFGFSNELSEKEYIAYKKECTELFEQKEYIVGMEKIKTLCYLFPTNDKLKVDLVTNAMPYLALTEDIQMREQIARQMITLCQNCTDENIQSQKHFVLAHLFMLIGKCQDFGIELSPQGTNSFAAIDMTNGLLLRTSENVIDKIENAVLSLGIQLIYELRNKSSYLQREGDLQGALEISEKQVALVELLELDTSIYFMLYMNISNLYCLLGQIENALKAVEKFVKLFREKPITDQVLLHVYKAGFSPNQFDLIKDTSIFKELQDYLNKEDTV